MSLRAIYNTTKENFSNSNTMAKELLNTAISELIQENLKMEKKTASEDAHSQTDKYTPGNGEMG